MAQVTLKGNPVNTCGDLPARGSKAPDFALVAQDLSEISRASFSGKNIILNIFPSIDTPTCALSTKRFNEEAAKLDDTVVICVSKDLPFAQKRFCGAEGIKNVETGSAFRSSFGKDFGVELVDGPLKGITSRAVVVLGKDGSVIYSQLVSEIADEPDYGAALSALA